jgi:hypothetical protein
MIQEKTVTQKKAPNSSGRIFQFHSSEHGPSKNERNSASNRASGLD